VNRPRFTLASLLGLVALIALGFAGLFSATTFWTSAAATLTLALLLGAVLGIVLLHGVERAFWLGFALFGGVYLVMVEWDWIGGQLGHDLTAGLSDVAEQLLPPPSVASPPTAPGFFPQVPVETTRSWQIKTGNFVQIGRFSLAILFAVLGGLVARWFFQRRERETRPSDPST
jgi:hypothetical protein